MSGGYWPKLSATIVRFATIVWRMVCLAVTAARHPILWRRPALMLKYETEAQKAAYSASCQPTASDSSRIKRVLVVVPFRDKWDMTLQCINSIQDQQTDGMELLIGLVDNGSVEAATKSGIAYVIERSTSESSPIHIRHLTYDIPFNFSRLNNLAVHDCADFRPEFVVFLNNDVVLEDSDSIRRLTGFLRENSGAASVGCTLLYPGRSIQHLCIAVGVKVVGAHPFKGRPYDPADAWYNAPRPVGAATAAFLAVKRDDFVAAGGFDEDLANCYQDVDLALKFTASGKANWVLPNVVAIHHETSTRQPVHHWAEVRLMHQRWHRTLLENPFYSRSFSRWSEQPALTLGEGKYPWQWLAKGH